MCYKDRHRVTSWRWSEILCPVSQAAWCLIVVQSVSITLRALAGASRRVIGADRTPGYVIRETLEQSSRIWRCTRMLVSLWRVEGVLCWCSSSNFVSRDSLSQVTLGVLQRSSGASLSPQRLHGVQRNSFSYQEFVDTNRFDFFKKNFYDYYRNAK